MFATNRLFATIEPRPGVAPNDRQAGLIVGEVPETPGSIIEHTVSISEFMVRLELALRGRSDVRILERGEILEDAPKTNRDRMVKLEASIRLGGALRKNAIVPDALFGLRFNDEEESYFMREIDRGGDGG